MATLNQAQAVKSLNTTPGRRNRRFVFKSFAQRIDELDVNSDVFRSLEPLKAEPSSGSNFFLDCLLQWRELNTAEDFISFYEEMIPLVQTLPLVLLHKDMIIAKLLSRLKLEARLSLEPILRLIAELSRDILEDFLPFLPRIIESYLDLLKDGADREPEIIEQIFTSWSYIIMYLQHYLSQDVVYTFKVTVKLRYYSKAFVREFMAEALSFLLRNAPTRQFIKGIRKILCEAAKKPSQARISGVSALLWHVMRGTSLKFHSRAVRALRLLIDNSTLSICDKISQGSDTVTEIVSMAFQRSCMELNPSELKLLWDCLYEEISNCRYGGSSLHLSHLLSVLVSSITVDHGRKVYDYKPLLELSGSLVQAYIVSNSDCGAEGSEVTDKIYDLMLCVLDGIHSCHNLDALPSIALQWAPAFQLRTSSLLKFLKELVSKEYALLPLRSNIISGLLNLLEMSGEGGIYGVHQGVHLMLTFCESLQVQTGSCSVLEGMSDEVVSSIERFFKEGIDNWIKQLQDLKCGDLSCHLVNKDELALLWGIVHCIPYILSAEKSIVLVDLVDRLDELLLTEEDDVAGVTKQLWQGLIGAALCSYNKVVKIETNELEYVTRILCLAKKYKSSRQILAAVADYLDLRYGSTNQMNSNVIITHTELAAQEGMDALRVFSENLYNPDKGIRVSTLRILCHYELLDYEPTKSKQVAEVTEEQMDVVVSEGSHADPQDCNVLKLLLTIEETPVSIATSRKVSLLVSRIQTCLSAPRTSEVYVLPAFFGIIGLLNNKFLDLSNSVLECLSVAINAHPGLLWGKFISYFELCQAIFLKTHGLEDTAEASLDEANDLAGLFRSFCHTVSFEGSCSLILSLLIQALQKIPAIVESRSRQVVPLFLKFLGYTDENPCVGSFDSKVCRVKNWRPVLMEWLSLLTLMKNPRSFYRSQLVKEVLVNRLLDDNDADIQTKVLDCLLNWKDGFLLPYEKHLKNLVTSKYLREELATWSLSKESNLIEEEHRAKLVPLVIRLLMPKVRNLRTLAPRKHASLNNRKAVLGFIAQLSVDELPLFFELLMKSLQIPGHGSDTIENCIWNSGKSYLDQSQSSNILEFFTRENIVGLPWKKRYGFLHVVEDILGVFGATSIRPFLDLLIGCVVRTLESCASSLYSRSDGQSTQLENSSATTLPVSEGDDKTVSSTMKQFKDMRSICLRIISFVLNKYEDHDFGTPFWDRFFEAVKPLICAFKQEGSSSKKPSSLFSCFLVMSQSKNLVSLLCREKNLIPDIFSILSIPTASEAIVSGVLKFIENLLTLEVDLVIEKDVIRMVLVSSLDNLVDSLHHLVCSKAEKKRKLLQHSGETLLKVFKLLSKYVRDQSAARKFVDILLPLASDGTKNSDICMEALKILQDVIPVLGSESTTAIFKSVSPVLISAQLDLRLTICNLFDALAESDSSIAPMAKLVRDLNATSAMEMGDLDFDTIIKAYGEISPDFFYGVTKDQALVILSHFIYDMVSEEIILRQCAYKSLLSFVDFSARVIGEENCEGNMAVDTCSWTRDNIQYVVSKFLLKHVGDVMSKETTIRKEWVDLLHEMVLKIPGDDNLGTLKALCSDDAEVDFFNNIVHLQKHRRARALSRFCNVVGTVKISEVILKRIFIPLFFSMLFELQTGKGEHIRVACLDALACVSGQLEWKSYYDFLMRCFREMTKKPDREKVLIRLVCSILDHFHFSGTFSMHDMSIPSHDVVGNDTTVQHGSVMSAKCASLSTSSRIQSRLTGTVLPKLQKLLVVDSDKVNVNISVAILKVLKILPGDTMDSQLPSIIHRIANFLKHRMESIRDEARSALAACLKELGFEFLQFVVKIMMATLKRGFEVHVLGYTLNFILSKGLPNIVVGELDHCLDELLSVVDNDIFGEVAEQKEVEKVASKMKETRKHMSFQTLKLIAQNVTFKTHGLKLLSPVNAHLQKHLTPKVKSKLETMLSHIAEGFERNPSVSQTDLFIFVYSLIDDWLSEESHKGDISLAERSGKQHGTRGKMGLKGNSERKPQSYLITVFALGLLQNRLRNIKFNRGDDKFLSMLDPFIKLLTSCLSCNYEEIITATLNCILSLIRVPLPSFGSQADKIKLTLLDIVQSSCNVNSPITQSCLKLLTAMLRGTRISLSTDQLHVLIQSPLFVDVETNPSFVALSLLKAIVRRKLVCHEIYDLATQVAKLMVTSQDEAIRKKCSQIFLQFLLNYQLSEKRTQQHLDFLVDGLKYEHASGREAVLEMLKTIIKRFPENRISKYSETFFFPLVLALANDHDNQVRSLIGIVIKHLITRINSQKLDLIYKFCLALYLGKKQQLWSTAAQVLGFVVEVMKRGFHKHVGDVLPVMRRILLSTTAVCNGRELHISDQDTVSSWKDAYYSLVLLEKILVQMPDLFFLGDIEDIWRFISELLMHPHPWVCNISSRLVALYFEQMGKQRKEPGVTCLTSAGRLFLIGSALCGLLKLQLPDKGARKLVKCNLAYAICGLQSLLHKSEIKDPSTFWASLAPNDQECYMKACQLLDPSSGKSIQVSLTCGFDNEDSAQKDKDLSYLIVSGLLNTMGKTALQTEDMHCKIVLGSFKLIAAQMSCEDCQKYADQLLLPIYRLCEGFAGKVVSDDVKRRAEKVRQQLQETLGRNFAQAYSQIRHKMGEKRFKRKREEKVMAVTDPIRNAKRKMRMSAKHQAHKKRKMMAMKMSRWMH